MSGNQKQSKKSFALPSDLGLGGVPILGPIMEQLLRVPIDYILEIWKDGKLHIAISLPNTPDSIHVQRPTPLLIRHTLGDMPRREVAQSRSRQITLSGRSGLASRQGYDREGGQFFKPGPEIFLEFDAFLQEYTRLCEEHGAQGINRRIAKHPKYWTEQRVFMVFRALNEKVHLLVEPQNWVWVRSAERSRFSYEWQLALQGYNYAQEREKTILDRLADIGDTVGDAIDLVAASIGMVANLSSNLRSSLDAIVSPSLNALRNAVSALEVARNEIGNLARFPKDVLAHFATTAVLLKNQLHRWDEIQDPFDGDTYSREIELLKKEMGAFSTEMVRTSHLALMAAGGGPSDTDVDQVGSGLRGSTPRGDGDHRDTPAARRARAYQHRLNNSQDPSIAYRVQPGDTLLGLAEHFLGDGDLWTDIAFLNGFEDASIGPDGSTLTVGQVIRIPGSADSTLTSIFPRATTLAEMMGRDIFINFDTWDLEPFGTGDIRTITGARNLEQALGNRVLTQQGECPLFPTYGLPIAPGTVVSPRTAGFLGAHVQNQLLADPRVVEVVEIIIEDAGDTIAASATITPTTGAAMEIITPVRAAGM